MLSFKNALLAPAVNINYRWPVFFRKAIAGFAFVHFLFIQPDFNALYSTNAYVYPDILDASYDHYSPTILDVQTFLNHFISINYDTLLIICRLCYPVFLALLFAGVLTRISSIASLFFQLLLIKSIHLYEYGVDYYATISLFYCCIYPVQKATATDDKSAKERNKLFLLLLQAHLSIAYFFSGFDKIIGETWRNGEAMWKTLHSHVYTVYINLDFLATTPFFLLAGWATVFLEMFYPVFMNISRFRKYWLYCVIGLHLFIALFMGLVFFSLLLVILNLAAFYIPYRNSQLPRNIEITALPKPAKEKNAV